jgi:hypothetical protein
MALRNAYLTLTIQRTNFLDFLVLTKLDFADLTVVTMYFKPKSGITDYASSRILHRFHRQYRKNFPRILIYGLQHEVSSDLSADTIS